MTNKITEFVGTINISDIEPNNILAADPCYSFDVWCIHKFLIKPGVYDCYVTTISKGEEKRVKEAFIVKHNLDPNNITFYLVPNGNIGVDSGQCGFYLLNDTSNKGRLFTDIEYHKICNDTLDKDWSITDKGFFTSSGYGDGNYQLFVDIDCNAAKLVYINDDEELEM